MRGESWGRDEARSPCTPGILAVFHSKRRLAISREPEISCSNAKNSVGGAPGKEMSCKADGFSVAEVVGKGVEGQNIRSLEGMEQH